VAPQRRRLWSWLAVGGVILVAALGVGIMVWRPGRSPHLASPAASLWTKPARQDFDLKVTLAGLTPDRDGTYALSAGQPVRFVIESRRDIHVGIWSLEANAVIQLFPNRDDEDNLVQAGVPRFVPGNSKYRIPATAADRVEYFRIVASTVPWTAVPGRPEGRFQVFERGNQEYDDWEDLQAELTGLRGVKIQRLKPPEPAVSPEQSRHKVSVVVLPYRVR
jgi:hypothetical protein